MNLNGLCANFLGDSITEPYGTTAPEKAFHHIIKEKCGLKSVYNYGIGGTRIARQIAPSENTKFDLTFEIRSVTMNKEADLIVVFGGTNDYGHGDAPFGTLEDTTDATFCGAVESLINSLKTNFPESKLVFMTPLHRENEDVPSEPDGKILKDYVDAILTICERNNVSVIDLFKINPIDVNDKELLPDGLHPSDKGHAVMAEVIIKELSKL